MSDLISRQTAIDSLKMDVDIIPFNKAREYVRATLETVQNRLEQLPSTQPEPKHGWWKGYTASYWTRKYDVNGDPEYKPYTLWICSCCKRRTVIRENYCPTCGAKMDLGEV